MGWLSPRWNSTSVGSNSTVMNAVSLLLASSVGIVTLVIRASRKCRYDCALYFESAETMDPFLYAYSFLNEAWIHASSALPIDMPTLIVNGSNLSPEIAFIAVL
jgi:hypothetical protein